MFVAASSASHWRHGTSLDELGTSNASCRVSAAPADGVTELRAARKPVTLVEHAVRTIKTCDIANLNCSKITSTDVLAFARALPVKPQTVQNYLSHLSAVFAIARAAWGYPPDARVTRTRSLSQRSSAPPPTPGPAIAD
jgi:hypothetical protein